MEAPAGGDSKLTNNLKPKQKYEETKYQNHLYCSDIFFF